MNDTTIGFIGAGNMTTSLIGGLIADGWSAQNIIISDPDADRREALVSRYQVHSNTDNLETVMAADVLVLAVKPQLLNEVCTALADTVTQKNCLVISIAAGIRLDDISRWLGQHRLLVRTMPNTPALVQSGATALFADSSVDAGGRDLAETIMRAVGLTLWLDNEQQIDAVTAVSGSGPAYFFYVMEAMQAAAEELGLSTEQAQLLTVQTAFGAAKMALESPDKPEQLRQQVTSPGGTTERALSILETAGLKAIFQQALNGARDRSIELADMFGDNDE